MAEPPNDEARKTPVLSQEETLELLASVMKRRAIDRQETAVEMLRKKYPAAPDEMLRVSAFHLYFDLPTQMIELAAKIELSLRNKDAGDFYVEISCTMYNLYNALMFERIVPEGTAGLLEHLEDIQECLDAKDLDNVQNNLDRLKRALSGSESAPDFD